MTRRSPRLALFALLALAGCSKSTMPTEAKVAPPANPAPDPVAAVQALASAMNHRNAHAFDELLTSDYQFAFAATDDSGDPFVGHALGRAEEETCSVHMFETGNATMPPANTITLGLDPALADLPDPRSGKDPTAHRMVETAVSLSIDAGVYSFRILGHARFFMVRGDSAAIPSDLAVAPNAGRWWIERIEDETTAGPAGLPPMATGTLPGHNVTWGSIQALYY